MVCMLFVAFIAQAQENTFVFNASTTGEFSAAHSTTDFSGYTQATLKISGPLNGADIDAIRTLVTASTFTSLDLSDAQITAEGTYTSNGSRKYQMNADRIAVYMFYQLSTLKSIVLPQSVTHIETYAFEGCSNLVNVTTNESLVDIGSSAFSSCSSLTSIVLPSAIKSIPYGLFYNCTNLASIEMADDITSIGQNAFYGCKSITRLDFSSALESTGNYAFAYCTSLREVLLSPNLTSLGTSAFQNCTSLEEISLPGSLKVIPSSLFSNCSSLKTVNAAADLTSIGSSAFHNCAVLEGFNIPATVTSLGSSAFYGCARITRIDFPTTLTAIPDNVCQNCTSLTQVTIPVTVKQIGSNAFNGCTSLANILLPENLATIKNSAFHSTAISDITLPASVTSIGAAAFANCDNLVTFTVNEGCTSITGTPSAWDGCDNLTAIYLPSTITTLYYGTFSGIANLREVHVKMTEPINPNGGNYSFGKEGCTLYVPQGTADAYKAHSYWNLRWTAIVEEDYTLASLTDDEWNILKQIPALTGGDNWKNKWVFAETKEDTEIPNGVTISNGHVASIILTDNNLTGSIPYIIFTLPAISSIDLSNNSLTGDIGGNPNDAGNSAANIVCTSLTSLNISNNELTGDLYRVMDFAPNLTVLRAGYNKIRDISGILPVYTLEYHAQDLSDIYSVNYSDLYNLRCNPDDATSVPTVFTYRNIDKSTAESNIDSHSTYFNVNISDNPGDKTAWYMTLTKRVNANSGVSYYSTASWCDGWYTRPTGNTLYAAVGTVDWEDCHKFNIVLDYEMGDVNFDTELNITDMQRTLNYALDSEYYHRYTPFNFTAANIIDSDNTINVQDVVANINILLNEGVTPRLAKGNRSKAVAQDEEPEAVLYVKDGKLMLSATRPVAALDIVLSGGNVKWSSATDFFSKKSKGERTIIYSLFGDEIMEGETILAEFDGTVTDAMLVDIDGNEIRRAIATGGFDGTTSIDTPSASGECNGAVYDLQGRKVADKLDRKTLKPGIYIVGDKKIQL